MLAKPLARIYNQSLKTEWKKAEMAPIFKKGNRNDPGNYRPISLTSIPCTVMESIIKDALVEKWITMNLINKCQHGFVKGRSCLTNLLETFENWTKALDE